MEVDIGLSESANNLTSGDLEEVIFKVTKVQLTLIVLTVAPRPWVHRHTDKNVHHCPINNKKLSTR